MGAPLTVKPLVDHTWAFQIITGYVHRQYYGPWFTPWAVQLPPFPMIDWVTTFLRQGVTMKLHKGSTMAHRRMNATKHSSPTASQLEGHNASESSSSEIKINVTPDDHPPRATRSRAVRAILQDTPLQSEEGGSSSGSGEESGSKSDAASGSQSDDGSGGNGESESGSQEDANTSPPTVNTKAETGVREVADVVDEDIEITTDDTMVQYVHIHEYDPIARQQLIDCFRFVWTVNRSEEFFNNGIVTKTDSFKRRAIMPETKVVVADIKSFHNIYRTFQLHQFDWMNNTPGEYSSHLTKEFYVSYATTLMNIAADTETTKRG
ncbi:hypothetical protein KY284_007749 [Solanum tuberosum]|nr:hypothetical protein KY284_007749 [Solanum tuberosum]